MTPKWGVVSVLLPLLFWDLSTLLEQMKLGTSNVIHKLSVTDISWLILVTVIINLCTRYEVSSFTHSKNAEWSKVS